MTMATSAEGSVGLDLAALDAITEAVESDRSFGGGRHGHRLRRDAIPVVREGRSAGRAYQEKRRQDV